MRLLCFVVAVCTLASAASPARAQGVATRGDVDRLLGPGWAGTLTYRDYTTEARTTIKAALRLEPLAAPQGGGTRWLFSVAYADEPHANRGDTISLAPDGRTFRDARVTARRTLPDGRTEIVTEEDGRDNDRPARIRLVYRIGEHAASLQKLVRYEGAEYFERHIYEWTR